MSRQLSTAISDAVLALSAFRACAALTPSSMTAVLGFLLIGVAATFGARRFSSSAPDYWVVQKHQYMSWLARVLGMSCIAAAYYRSVYNYTTMANVHMALALAVCVIQYLNFMSRRYLDMLTEITGSGAVVSTLVYSVLAMNAYGILGAGLYAAAGLAVGTVGRQKVLNFYVPRVDIFHYMLAVGNIALLMGLSESATPIFFYRRG